MRKLPFLSIFAFKVILPAAILICSPSLAFASHKLTNLFITPEHWVPQVSILRLWEGDNFNVKGTSRANPSRSQKPGRMQSAWPGAHGGRCPRATAIQQRHKPLPATPARRGRESQSPPTRWRANAFADLHQGADVERQTHALRVRPSVQRRSQRHVARACHCSSELRQHERSAQGRRRLSSKNMPGANLALHAAAASAPQPSPKNPCVVSSVAARTRIQVTRNSRAWPVARGCPRNSKGTA